MLALFVIARGRNPSKLRHHLVAEVHRPLGQTRKLAVIGNLDRSLPFSGSFREHKPRVSVGRDAFRGEDPDRRDSLADRNGFEPAVPLLNSLTTTLGDAFITAAVVGLFQNRNREFESTPLRQTDTIIRDFFGRWTKIGAIIEHDKLSEAREAASFTGAGWCPGSPNVE